MWTVLLLYEMRSDTKWKSDGSGKLVMPELQDEFLEWLLTHEYERVPRTEQEWGQLHGVAHNTLQYWKRDKRFREQWNKRHAETMVSPARMQSITDSLFAAAKGGDIGAAKQYAAMVEKMQPPVQVTRDAQLMAMTDAELVAEVEAALDVLAG